MKQEERILNAVELLKLPRSASVRQLQTRYRELVKQHHPDHQNGKHDPEMARINEAYAMLMDYCHNYKIPFDSDKLQEEPHNWWMDQFGENL
ncbi:MAG: J domain-containing protein [Opitutales bacterium]